MKRKVIKTLTNKEIDFVPEEYGDLKVDAENIYDRPLIFVGRKMSRDEYFEFQELTRAEYPEGMDISKMSKEERIANVRVSGRSKAYRFAWDKCVTKLKNVIIEKEGVVEELDICEDTQMIWSKADGLNSEIMQAIAFFIGESSFGEAESKNSK